MRRDDESPLLALRSRVVRSRIPRPYIITPSNIVVSAREPGYTVRVGYGNAMTSRYGTLRP